MEITKKKFNEIDKEAFGLVVLGAGEPLSDWVTGIEKLLRDENIATGPNPVFSDAFVVCDNKLGADGRTDLVLTFNKEATINTGMLAMWRLKFRSCSWIEDYVVNYKNDYASSVSQTKPALELVGHNGNAFMILGRASEVARKNKMDWESIRSEATAGDYDHLLQTMMKYFEVD